MRAHRSAVRRIAILTSNFWPEPTSTGQTVWEFAHFLAQRGLDVRVATSMPYYPQWRIWKEYRGALWATEHHEGVSVLRSWHFVAPRPSTLTRLLHETTLSLVAMPQMIRALRGAAVAYIVSPALGFAVTASVMALLFRVRRVLVVKDVMPDAAVELGMLRNPLVIAVSRWLARRIYDGADEIHTLGEGMRARIARGTRAPEKIRVVPDTIDSEELRPVPFEANEFRRRFVPGHTFAVVHTGNMGKKQDLELLLRAAQRLKDEPRVRFYVFGEGAVKEAFLRRRDELRLENVSYHPLVERCMLRHLLSGADVVLVSQRAEVVDIVVPSKLITSLGAGAMIIAACPAGSETARLLERSAGGITIPAGDDAALAEQIRRLESGAVETSPYRQRARAFAMRVFDRASVYGPLVEELSLADSRGPGNETSTGHRRGWFHRTSSRQAPGEHGPLGARRGHQGARL